MFAVYLHRTKTQDNNMEILETYLNVGLNQKWFHFEDDKSITIDMSTLEVVDCDGWGVIPESRIKTVESYIGNSIIY